MSDDQHSNPIPAFDALLESWEHHAVFRESFLSLLSAPDAAAFRLVGRRLYYDRLEAVRPESPPSTETSTLRRELASAAADLVVLAGFLSAVGGGLDLSPGDQPLVRKAQESAAISAQLACRLRGALDAGPDPSPPAFRASSS
jgi:hypothetical protein